MRLTHMHVRNYRGLRDVSVPLSRFGCFIGKNNAGKSTILQSLDLFFRGEKVRAKDYFDESQSIRIEIRFEDITESDLERLDSEPRERLRQIVDTGTLTLARIYDTTGSSRLWYITKRPKDRRFWAENLATLMKNKRGATLFEAVKAEFPELDPLSISPPTQSLIHAELQKLVQAMPPHELESTDSRLPTGIDASIEPFLPEPIYIAAVKDLSDEMKAKESTPFGKVLGILLKAIEPDLGSVKEFFATLSSKLNVTRQDDGTLVDTRLRQVQQIEETVQKYLRESFSNVTLQMTVPPPELKSILSGAQLVVDDGVRSSIEQKGDGLRRAAVFSILRAYVMLREPGALGPTPSAANSNRYVLLFEEPELYLHPSAQNVLFDALSVFSSHNQVLITTHSPSFFDAKSTASFVKVSKIVDQNVSATPFSTPCHIDLTEMTAKDQFQLICFENNNAAFFFDSVVLVEGDSDFLAFPHIATLLNPAWDSSGSTHKFVRISGKGSIRRYRDFFSRFRVKVAVVTDLDILVSGFEVLNPARELQDLRGELLNLVDKAILDGGGFPEPTEKGVKKAQQKTELLGKWKTVKSVWAEVLASKKRQEDLEAAVADFFSWENAAPRLEYLRTASGGGILSVKRKLLSLLRDQRVFVLEKGALEAYYPSTVLGKAKPEQAQHFCETVRTRDDVLRLCGEIYDEQGNSIGSELEIICHGLFGDHGARLQESSAPTSGPNSLPDDQTAFYAATAANAVREKLASEKATATTPNAKSPPPGRPPKRLFELE